MINLLINGEAKNLELSENRLLCLIQLLQLNPNRIVVELNGEIFQSTQFENLTLNENDRIEFIHFMGGG